MKKLKDLFDNNRRWAREKVYQDPEVFVKGSQKQTPKYLWIGCSDSRVPANEIIGLDASEVFVHRNVANLCPHTDFNCLSVLEYGIRQLDIEHIILCGHYQCGGVAAAMGTVQFGLVDNWLRHIRDVYAKEHLELDTIENIEARYNRLVELNVMHQVMNICHTTIVQNAWAKGRPLSVHGWVYDVYTGLLKDLDCCISSIEQVHDAYKTLKIH